MSSWIKSHQAVRDHPKTRKLARRVGDLPRAIGILHCLWWWCLDYAPDGDLSEHDHEDIAIACAWEGEAEDVVRYLTECGFLDDDSGLRVHDWGDYAGALVEARERNAERMRKQRAGDVPSTFNARAGLERKKDREKELTERGAGEAVDNVRSRRAGSNSTTSDAPGQNGNGSPTCWRCGDAISSDDVLDGKCVDSRKGLRHKECTS